MAINLNVSENQESISLRTSGGGLTRTISPDDGNPYYVGARAYVEQTENGATITVIDKDGTTTANISNGVDGADGADGATGADGFSPSATVEKVGDTATITITDKNGTTTAEIHDGSGGGGATAFVAEFNVTPYADIKDAYDDDAIIICTADDSGNTKIFQLAYFDDENSIFYFAEPTGDGWDIASISENDGWDNGIITFASTDVATQLRDGLMSALDKQKLDGLSPRNIWYGTCSTGASNSPKTVTTASGDFSLTAGSMLVVKFSTTNALSSTSLQVDGGTSKSVYQLDGTSDVSNRWGSGEVVMFVYDGTKFILLDQSLASTTAYGITKLNNTTSSTSTSEAATAKAVKTAYDLANGKSAVSIDRKTTTGTNIADITIDGTTTQLYAPNGGGGTITDVTVDGTSVVSGSVAEIDLTGKSDVGHTHTQSDITDFPTLSTVATTGDYDDLLNKPTLFSGSYDDLSNKPTLFSGAYDDLTGKPTLFSGNYNDLTNKPTIPTVNNATLTIQKNGSTVKTFTANASTNVTANITVPTKVSDLTNDSGFITGYTETDPVFYASAAHGITASDINNWNSKSDFSGSYNDLSNKPTIPTALSDLTNDMDVSDFPNDAGYLTSFTETDPVFTASAAYGISSSDITNWNGKQAALVSGTNIKTINNESILGSGNITVQGGGGGGTLVQIVRW